jgi:hypothetical protein
MLASSGTQATISYFLRLNRLRSPLIKPRYIISDFDWAQIHACIAEYEAFILLCWWHVLHAWQQHFKISSHPDLWELLKQWIRITDEAEFYMMWNRINSKAPQSFCRLSDAVLDAGAHRPHVVCCLPEKSQYFSGMRHEHAH